MSALTYELFENKRDTFFVIDTTTLKCDTKYFEKNIFQDTVKQLVNVQTVLKNLKEIAYLQTMVNADSLKKIYHRHANQYDEDWGPIYLNSCLDQKTQAVAGEQFKVLKAFEECLKSLSLKEKNSVKIWNRFKLDHQQYYEYAFESNYDLEVLESYSDVYRKLNRKAWYACQLEFRYIDPYLTDIKDSLIHELKKYDCPIDIDLKDLNFLQQVMHYVYKINDNRIPEVFIKNQKCLASHPAYFWFPVRYLEQNYHRELLEVTLKELFKEDAEYHIDYKIAHISRNSKNRIGLEHEINQAILAGSKPAIYYSRNYQSKEILKSLKIARREFIKNQNLMELIESSIDQVENRINNSKQK